MILSILTMLVMVSCSLPQPVTVFHLARSIDPRAVESGFGSPPETWNQNSPRSPSSLGLLAPRMLTDIPDPIETGMISPRKYTKLGTLVPIMVAAQSLGAFYQAIVTSVYNQWLYTPQMDSFLITQGQMELSFLSSGSDIPWDFVAAFAKRMAERVVAQGSVDIYDSIWTNPARTIGIHVAFRLKDAAGL